MNTRSVKFQLTVWYAGLLTAAFAVLGVITYVALKGYLENTLKAAQLRRATQISRFLLPEMAQMGEHRLVEEIEARYAPGANNQFIRVTRGNGTVLYLSNPPRDRGFDPTGFSPAAWPPHTESTRREPLPGGRRMLVVSYALQGPRGQRFLIESGAPLDAVDSVLRQLFVVLIVSLPVASAVAVAGGTLLVKRALSPVSQITASAESITLHNLSERLPVAHTGDEVEQLSLALNRMILRLDEAFQYSRRFVADASHELRTPMTALRSELESLLQDGKLALEVREKAASLLEEAERLSGIVEGLFALSRLDAGEAQQEWVCFDLGELVASTADQMALLAEDKGIIVTCEASKSLLIEGDRARLKQVIVNLLDNAIKYTPAGGAVTLRVSSAAERAVLEVIDNGIGIPPDALPHIFERFYRVDKARSREQGGAGLGLAIVKSICTAHGGTVSVQNEPGHGSRFRVELPVTGERQRRNSSVSREGGKMFL